MVKYMGCETGVTAAELKQIRKKFPTKKKIKGIQCDLISRVSTKKMAEQDAKRYGGLFGTKIIAIEKRIDEPTPNGISYEVWGVNTPEFNEKMKKLRKSIRRVN